MVETKSGLNQNYLMATGRRKTAVARVRIKSGEGKIVVNDRGVQDYFKGLDFLQYEIFQPLKLTNYAEKLDVFANVKGGGVKGQAEAIRHGIARALVNFDPKTKVVLKKNGLLTRDPRMVERKKAGQPKARKKFQWTKR